MKVFNSFTEFTSPKKTIVTIGTFDGVHIGHQSIIKKLTDHNGAYQSVVMTFFPHPRMVLRGNSSVQLLNTIEEKTMLLGQFGLENLIVQAFDLSFSQLSAHDFVKEILVDALHIHKIIIGHDHRFGNNRSADITDLIAFGKQYNFEVEQISAQEIADVSVSSTKIRNALTDGNIELANQYLGYEYPISGTVIHGKKMGRTLNFPTANIQIPDAFKLIPKNGVYIVFAYLKNKKVFGMMNIGTNPTVNGTTQSIEVYFLDFEADLYDQQISVFMIHRLRDEQKFESIEALKIQLEKDKKTTQQFINSVSKQ